jgi:hypothetical protein
MPNHEKYTGQRGPPKEHDFIPERCVNGKIISFLFGWKTVGVS